MKRILLIALAGAFLSTMTLSTMSFAQDTMKPDAGSAKTSAKTTVSIPGKISDDGKSFVADKDGKSWNIENPDAVKGHEGHHVILKAHPDADKMEVHVVSLKMAKDAMSKDSMKQ
jgi:hypothetical protein